IHGKYAAVMREQQEGEIRSNIHQAAKAQDAEITAATLELAGLAAEKLVWDMTHWAGLEIVGYKIMEVNVFSPGALNLASELNKVDFVAYVVTHLEKKIAEYYGY